MAPFEMRDNVLHCENLPLDEMAERFGTPLFVYSHAAILRKFSLFKEAFADREHLICYSLKANSNLAVLKLLANRGSGADIVSGGELFRALRAGIPARKIVYSGVGKTAREMSEALDADILMFNVESMQELELLDAVAGQKKRIARVSFRVNPDVDPKTHPYVATGLKSSKFGIAFEETLRAYDRAAQLGNLELIGVDCHIGSQLLDLGPFVDAVMKLNGLIAELRSRGHDIRYLDIGGGLGIRYDSEAPPSPRDYGKAVNSALNLEGLTVILEPGRNLVGNGGILLTRVLYAKSTEKKQFVIVDAGMNDLIRPSLYDAFHFIEPVVKKPREMVKVDVVGPICESGDFIARERLLQRVEAGDLLAVRGAGAYGMSMASTYNSRPLAAEVLVRDNEAFVVRKRGTYEDLVAGEEMFDIANRSA